MWKARSPNRPQLIEDAWCSLWREEVLSDTDIVDELCEQGLEQYRPRLQQRDGQHAAGAMTDEVQPVNEREDNEARANERTEIQREHG